MLSIYQYNVSGFLNKFVDNFIIKNWTTFQFHHRGKLWFFSSFLLNLHLYGTHPHTYFLLIPKKKPYVSVGWGNKNMPTLKFLTQKDLIIKEKLNKKSI